jgi:hypothetical protein
MVALHGEWQECQGEKELRDHLQPIIFLNTSFLTSILSLEGASNTCERDVEMMVVRAGS